MLRSAPISAVIGLTTDRIRDTERQRVVVTARLANLGTSARTVDAVLEVGGRAVAPVFERASATLDRGTLRVAMDFRVDTAPGTLRYEDDNFPDRPGWKEIVVAGQGQDRTKELTAYPPDALAAPPQEVRTTSSRGTRISTGSPS